MVAFKTHFVLGNIGKPVSTGYRNLYHYRFIFRQTSKCPTCFYRYKQNADHRVGIIRHSFLRSNCDSKFYDVVSLGKRRFLANILSVHGRRKALLRKCTFYNLVDLSFPEMTSKCASDLNFLLANESF